MIFYKNGKFTLANQAAQELIGVNLNTEEGHPLTKALNRVAQQVYTYKSSQTTMSIDHRGQKLMITGIPSLEGTAAIIMLYYPEISDLIKKQIDALQDPSKWDYLLYLQTTNAGKLVNELIPGSGEALLNFKIDLLKLALSIKPILLEMPPQDLDATVEIIHTISLRSTLHKLILDTPEKGGVIAIKLFGINPLYGLLSEKPLLETLNNNGTLFIKNVHYLSLETQEQLAEFVRYGFYHPVRNDTLMVAQVRIICSTDQDLESLVHDGKFSPALFTELKKSSLSLPSLLTLPETEIASLADGYAAQAIKKPVLTSLLALNTLEKNKLLNQRPVSLQEFKTTVEKVIENKTVKNKLQNASNYKGAYQVYDTVINAAGSGKQALQNKELMKQLWQEFQSQTKIATFLGVHRSSVSRRLKELELNE